MIEKVIQNPQSFNRCVYQSFPFPHFYISIYPIASPHKIDSGSEIVEVKAI